MTYEETKAKQPRHTNEYILGEMSFLSLAWYMIKRYWVVLVTIHAIHMTVLFICPPFWSIVTSLL